MENNLSDLVQIHSALQNEVQNLLLANKRIAQKNAEFEIQIAQVQKERDEFLANAPDKAQTLRKLAEANAEDAALDAMEKRISIVERRVASLQARHSAVQNEVVTKANALIQDCSKARDRFASSFQSMQARKNIFLEKQQGHKAEQMKLTVEMQQVQEVQARVEAELLEVKEKLMNVAQNCSNWMEEIGKLVKKRQMKRPGVNNNNPKTSVRTTGTSTAGQPSRNNKTGKRAGNNQPMSINCFDVVKAFQMQKAKMQIRSAGGYDDESEI